MFVSAWPFEPSVMFAFRCFKGEGFSLNGKMEIPVRNRHSGLFGQFSFSTRVGSSHSCKLYTTLERPGKNKHSSLLDLFVINEENLGTMLERTNTLAYFAYS